MNRLLHITIVMLLLGAALSIAGNVTADDDSRILGPRTANRVVLVEQFTCVTDIECDDVAPAVDQIATDYGNTEVAALQYFTGNLSSGLDTFKTNDRADDYNIQDVPEIRLDGTANIQGSQGLVQDNYDAIKGLLDSRLTESAPIYIESTLTRPTSSCCPFTFDATIDARSGSVSQGNLKVNFVLYESNVNYGGNTYNHVVRDIEVESMSNTGFPHVLQKEIPQQEGWNLQRIDAVIFVQVGDGGEVLQATNVGVNINEAPRTKTGAQTSVSFDEDTTDTSLDLDDIFEDPNEDPMTYSMSGNSKIDVSIGGGGVVTLTPETDWNGLESITFKADDGYTIGQQQIYVTVDPINDPPVVADQYSNPITLTILEDNAVANIIDLGDVFFDIDGDTLTYEFTGDEHLDVTISNGAVSVTPMADWTGTDYLTFTATDPGLLNVAKDITIVVTDKNDAPRIDQPIVDFNMDEDTTYSDLFLNLVFSDPEGSSLIFDYFGNIHLNVEIKSDGLVEITPEADWNGQEILTFAASDGVAESLDDVTVTVVPINDPPTLISIDENDFEDELELEFTEEQDYSYDVVAEDIDGDTLEFFIDGEALPESLYIDDDDGELEFSPTNDDVGSHQVTVGVKDGNGGEDSKTFTLTVINVNDPPTALIDSPANKASFPLGEYVELSGESSNDIDVGDTLKYTWNSDLEGEIGNIKAINYPFTVPGTHTITLTVEDTTGMTSTKQVQIIIEGEVVTNDDEPLVGGASDEGNGANDENRGSVSSDVSSDSGVGMAAYLIILAIVIIVILVLVFVFMRKKRTPIPPGQGTQYQPQNAHPHQRAAISQTTPTPAYDTDYSTSTSPPQSSPSHPTQDYSAWDSVDNGFGYKNDKSLQPIAQPTASAASPETPSLTSDAPKQLPQSTTRDDELDDIFNSVDPF